MAALAYERELATELEAVEAQFREWHAGNLSVHDLSHLIHQFHDRVARDLYVMYTQGQPGGVVAQAVARNVLHENDLPSELRQHLHEQIAFYKTSEKQDGAPGFSDRSETT